MATSLTTTQLLTNVTGGTSNGTWVLIDNRHPISLTVEGTFVGTVKLYGSNALNRPSDSDNAFPQLGTDLTAPGSVEINAPYRWVKAIVSAFVSGTINAFVSV